MKRVVKASASEARFAINRLRKYAVSDGTLVGTLCAKIIDHMNDDPEMTFEDAYDYLDAVTWENEFYPRVKMHLKQLGLWIRDDNTIRDITDTNFNK